MSDRENSSSSTSQNEPVAPQRASTSMHNLIFKFFGLFDPQYDFMIDPNQFAKRLNVEKEQVQDIIDVLYGFRLLKRDVENNTFFWTGTTTKMHGSIARLLDEFDVLSEKERRLDELLAERRNSHNQQILRSEPMEEEAEPKSTTNADEAEGNKITDHVNP